MCTVHDDIPKLARLSRLRKSQIKSLLVASSTLGPCATRVQARARRHRIEAPWLWSTAVDRPTLCACGSPTPAGKRSQRCPNEPANYAIALAAQRVAFSLDFRRIDDSGECNFLDNRCEWPIKSCDLLVMAHYSSGCSSCFMYSCFMYSTAPPRLPRKRPNKWPSS
jgi:hypothetical protein